MRNPSEIGMPIPKGVISISASGTAEAIETPPAAAEAEHDAAAASPDFAFAGLQAIEQMMLAPMKIGLAWGAIGTTLIWDPLFVVRSSREYSRSNEEALERGAGSALQQTIRF